MQDVVPKTRPAGEVIGLLVAVAIVGGLVPALAIASWLPASVPLSIALAVGLVLGLVVPAFLVTRAAVGLRRRGIKMSVQKIAGLLLLALLQGGPVLAWLRWSGKDAGALLTTYQRGIELFARPAEPAPAPAPTPAPPSSSASASPATTSPAPAPAAQAPAAAANPAARSPAPDPSTVPASARDVPTIDPSEMVPCANDGLRGTWKMRDGTPMLVLEAEGKGTRFLHDALHWGCTATHLQLQEARWPLSRAIVVPYTLGKGELTLHNPSGPMVLYLAGAKP